MLIEIMGSAPRQRQIEALVRGRSRAAVRPCRGPDAGEPARIAAEVRVEIAALARIDHRRETWLRPEVADPPVQQEVDSRAARLGQSPRVGDRAHVEHDPRARELLPRPACEWLGPVGRAVRRQE